MRAVLEVAESRRAPLAWLGRAGGGGAGGRAVRLLLGHGEGSLEETRQTFTEQVRDYPAALRLTVSVS